MSIATISNNIESLAIVGASISIAVTGDTASARRRNYLASADVPLETRALLAGIKGKDGAANREALVQGGMDGVQFRAYQGNWKPLVAAYVAGTARPIENIETRADVESRMLNTVNELIRTEELKKSKGLKKDGTPNAEMAKLLGIKAVIVETLRYIDWMGAKVTAIREAGEDVKSFVNAERMIKLGR